MDEKDRMPKLAWWVRLSVYLANYPRPSAGFPPMPRTIPQDVQCMVWGCEQGYVVRSWRHPFRYYQRPGCVHQAGCDECCDPNEEDGCLHEAKSSADDKR